jgi:glycosyltransferase involved in cell wall biosynthesis
LKIAIIVNPIIPVPPEKYGGIERIVFMLIKELMQNHEITLFAHPASKVDCDFIPYAESKQYGLSDFIKINLLTSKIAFQKFDLVHTFGRMNNIAMLMFFRLPKIVSYQLPPTVSQVKKATALSRKKSLYFTACSVFIENKIRPYCKISTIYNGVDLGDYHFNDSVEEDAPLVFLGRIEKIKGTHLAIEIAQKTGRNLIIAGNIPTDSIHQQYFEENVKPHIDNKRIKYIGPVDDTQKNHLLRNASAFLMPVTWDEPFGIVITESLACGTPVIGFNRGAIPEIITTGLNGFVCENMDGMIRAVMQINEIDRKVCREVVEHKFSSVVLAKQYEKLYQDITGKL